MGHPICRNSREIKCGTRLENGIIISSHFVNGHHTTAATVKSVTHVSFWCCIYFTIFQVQSTLAEFAMWSRWITVGGYEVPSDLLRPSETPDISKKYFRPGEMAPSEWTRSVRAVRDTPVADYSARGLNTMRRVAYRPPIAVSPFFLALSVSNFKRTLWWWRPTVTIRRNGLIGHAFASGLQCDGWRCENHSTHSFYPHAKCNSLFTNYTHHSKSPDPCGYWQSIARSVRLLSYYS